VADTLHRFPRKKKDLKGYDAFSVFLLYSCLGYHNYPFCVADGRIDSTGKRKGSPCEQDGDIDSQAGKIMRSIPELPEDILSCIHSLMPMREAARAACLSRSFLRSWRCHPNLICNKDTVGLKRSSNGDNFHHKIDRILRNHSGISLKSFKLDYSGMSGFDGTSYLDSWLEIALKPGMEELTL